MYVVELKTLVDAPQQVCFNLARSVRAHEASTSSTGEVAVSLSARDLLERGDEVEFTARHLGVRWKLRARIVEMEAPGWFADEQVKGPFRSLRHEHRFIAHEGGTEMTDTIRFKAPLGPIGWFVERLIIGPHLRRFLIRRNEALIRMAIDRG